MRVLFFVFIQQVEVTLVAVLRVHFSPLNTWPFHTDTGIGFKRRANGHLIVSVDMSIGIVDVSQLIPRDVAG